MSRTFEPHFFKAKPGYELVETKFASSEGQTSKCVSGKIGGVPRGAGCFQQASAVKGIASLHLRYLIAQRAPSVSKMISGQEASQGVSLNYALAKAPGWISHMFGVFQNGRPTARGLFLITNTQQKRPGPVTVSDSEQKHIRQYAFQDYGAMWESDRGCCRLNRAFKNEKIANMKSGLGISLFLSIGVLFGFGQLAQAEHWVFRNIIFAEQSADVVGRNLKVPGLGWLGHVGLYDRKTDRVLEILSEAKPIVTMQNTGVDFLRASGIDGYWGARYARPAGVPEVIVEGWWQRIFEPRYTYSSSWVEGKWVPVFDAKGKQSGWKKQAAVFRCDTFVAYSYQRSNQGLPSIFGSPQVPLTTYRKTPNVRPTVYNFPVPRKWL